MVWLNLLKTSAFLQMRKIDSLSAFKSKICIEEGGAEYPFAPADARFPFSMPLMNKILFTKIKVSNQF